MKKYLVFLSFSFALTIQSAAQTFEDRMQRLTSNDWAGILRGTRALPTRKESEAETRGFPFVFDTWDNGVLTLRDSSRVSVESGFKINVEDHEIWTRGKEEREYVLTDDRIIAIELQRLGGKHTFKKILLPETKSYIWGEIMFDGSRFALIHHLKKTFEAANYEDKGVAVIGKKYNSFDTAEFWYIVVKTPDKLKKVKLKRGDFSRVAGISSDEQIKNFREFCKKQDISSDLSLDDAIELLEYLDKEK